MNCEIGIVNGCLGIRAGCDDRPKDDGWLRRQPAQGLGPCLTTTRAAGWVAGQISTGYRK